MTFWDSIKEKFNPVQSLIAQDEGQNIGSTQNNLLTINNAYDLVEVVNRCINLIVDNAALIDFDVKDTLSFTGRKPGKVKQPGLLNLLNYRPNPYMDSSTFRRLVLMDFLIDGNAFIHFDGTALYHVPANKMEINPSSKNYVQSYTFDGTESFGPDEIIHVRDNNMDGLYRGDSRINSALSSILTRESMVKFQKAFFENGASVGLIIETEQLLNAKLKERQELDWVRKFNPKRSNNRPLILDNGMKAKSIGSSNFREMMFTENITNLEEKVCVALGVPPILLNSGNNANIKPNLELLFYTNIIPMMRKFESAKELYFAYDIQVVSHRVPALFPDQKDEAERISALVNNGIITGNEGRVMLRLDESDEEVMKKIRIPQNVAGSGTGVTGQQGGKPAGADDE